MRGETAVGDERREVKVLRCWGGRVVNGGRENSQAVWIGSVLFSRSRNQSLAGGRGKGLTFRNPQSRVNWREDCEAGWLEGVTPPQ